MANSNQDLMDLLDGIGVGEADIKKRDAHLKMLEHLCGIDYQIETRTSNLDKFIKQANHPKGHFTKLSHDIVDTALPEAKNLREKARHKLQLLKIEQRIAQVKDDFSAKKADIEILKAVAALQETSSRTTKGPEVFKGFTNFQYADYTTEIDKLVRVAEKKLKNIDDSRKVKMQEREDDIEKALKTNATMLSGHGPDSMDNLMGRMTDRVRLDELSQARRKLDEELKKNKSNLAKYTPLGWFASRTGWNKAARTQRSQEIERLEKERKDLEKAKRIVISAKSLIEQAYDRMQVGQKRLQTLTDELNLKKIQVGDAQYTVDYIAAGSDFPEDEDIQFGHIYCKVDAPPSSPPKFTVKCRSLTNRDKVDTRQLEMKDLVPPNPPKSSSVAATPVIPTSLDSTHSSRILHLLRAQKAIYDKAAYDPLQLDQDLASVKTTCLRVDNIKADMAECERMLTFCQEIVTDANLADAKKTAAGVAHKHGDKVDQQVNYLIRLMALSERQRYDEQKKHYFFEEIVSQDPAISLEQPRGLEGHIIYRGVHLNKDQIKRATCKTDRGVIVIESSVQCDKNGNEIGVVASRTINYKNLSHEDKQLAAIQFASDLLNKHRPGEPIVLQGGPECAEETEYVYSALLLLTIPEPDDVGPRFDPSCITVKVPGVKTPSLASKAWHYNDWREKFAESKQITSHPQFVKYKDEIAGNRKKYAKGPNENNEIGVGDETIIKSPGP